MRTAKDTYTHVHTPTHITSKHKYSTLLYKLINMYRKLHS